MKKVILYVIFCLGSICIVSPALLYWFIHGSYERYIWIINSQYPFNILGSGPMQLYLYLGFFLAGVTLISIVFKRVNKKFKYAVLASLILIVLLFASSFSAQFINRRISKSLRVEIPANLKVEYEDSHGGFHGDGDTLAKVYLNGKSAEEVIIEIKNKWKLLPLSENLNLLMYGGIKDNIEYSYNLANKFQIPHIVNGYWLYIDRHSNSADNSDADLFERHSFNFTLALYDAETNILYYIEFDT